MKDIVTYINESKNEWSKITAKNNADESVRLSNFAYNLNMHMVRSKYHDLCGINNTGTADQEKAIRYELNSCINGTMPKAQDVADALNKSELGYKNWEADAEDSKSITVKCSDKQGNKYFITCVK